MLSRISILSLLVTLSLFLSGECRAESANTNAVPLPQQVEITIVDADIPNPTSLLSGKDSSRTTNNLRRSLQRQNSKRLENLHFVVRNESENLVVENSQNTIQPTILGGVVAPRAFYSLCCLRI